jgi:hypothetical protein
MKNRRIVLPILVVAAAILFAGSSDAYATACSANPWGINYSAPRGTDWTGTIVVNIEIADVSGLPAGLPEWATPVDSPGYTDYIVKIDFVVKLENKKNGFGTFSGLAVDNDGYYLFYALGDYCSERIGEALNRFLQEKVYPKLPGGPYANGALTSVTETSGNVEYQLQVGRGLQAGTPLYHSAKITVVTW